MRTRTVCCARTPNLEIAFFSGDLLPAGGAFPWRRQDGVPKGRKGLASPPGRMCALCRQPRCGFCAHMSLAILYLQRKSLTEAQVSTCARQVDAQRTDQGKAIISDTSKIAILRSMSLFAADAAWGWV